MAGGICEVCGGSGRRATRSSRKPVDPGLYLVKSAKRKPSRGGWWFVVVIERRAVGELWATSERMRAAGSTGVPLADFLPGCSVDWFGPLEL